MSRLLTLLRKSAISAADVTAPSGYSVAFTTDPISDANAAAAAFQITGAEVGATYNYTITSSGGGTQVTGSGTISSSTQNVTGINVAGLGDGTLTVSLTLTDASNNTGSAATDTVTKDATIPSGYSAVFTTDPINNSNKTSAAFQISGAEVGATFNYTISSSGGGSNVTGSGTISNATQNVTGINVSGLGDGTLTVSLTLTDSSSNTGSAATDTVAKDATVPSGYSVIFTTDPISDANSSAAAFQFAGAETGCTFNYTINSSGGGTQVSGSGTISTATQNVTGINVSGLNDGTLTLSVTLTDAANNTGNAATDTVAKAFVPTDISSMALWLDASDLSSITDAGAGAVSQWNDKSGNARHATQSTGANRPVTGTRTLNSKNVLDFGGGDQQLDLPSGMYGVSAGANTVIVVAAADNTNNNHRFYNGTISGTTAVTIRYGSTTTYAVQNRTSLSLTTTTITRDTNAHASGFRRSGTAITGFFNGVEGTAGSNAQDATVDALSISHPTDTIDGLVAEVIVYAKSLSNAELNKVGNHLASKWGVTWTGV